MPAHQVAGRVCGDDHTLFSFMSLFQVKICGITTTADASVIGRSGADAIGLNFYPRSPRFVKLQQAGEIVAALPAQISRVGVFVNEKPSKIMQIARVLNLDYVQLHGSESLDAIQALEGRPYIRAFRFAIDGAKKHDGVEQIAKFISDCLRLDRLPAAVLVDAHVAGQYGGTGKTVDWQLLSRQRAELGGVPLILAGGLTPANVAESIRIVRPDAVDTASGVESEPGIKSERLIEEFVTRSLAAFGETSS